MRTFRLATQADIPALQALTIAANQPQMDLPDLAFLAEQDGRVIAAGGLELSHPGMVVISGGVIHPDYYRRPFLVFRLQEFVEDWLIANGCHAYVFPISKRNTRMQRWVERLGARRYTKKNGSYWYVRTIGAHRELTETPHVQA
jgi:hypothetical protein